VTLADPSLEFVFELRADVASPLAVGEVLGRERRIVAILGGIVSGPAIEGKVLPGGVDWQTIRPDGTAEIEARYQLETQDGAVIDVSNPGLRRAPPAIMRRLAEGLPVAPDSYYFRTTPRFETTAPAYRWLTESVFVCQGIRHPAEVVIRVFRVL
jgi:hypothetical protein